MNNFKRGAVESFIWTLAVLGAFIALLSHVSNKFGAFLIFLAAKLRGKGDGVSDFFSLHGEKLITSAVSIVQAGPSKPKNSNPAADEESLAEDFSHHPIRSKRTFPADGNIWDKPGETEAALSQSPEAEFEKEVEEALADADGLIMATTGQK